MSGVRFLLLSILPAILNFKKKRDMKPKAYEIVERSSGYWIVDGEGYAQGPYDTIKDAEDDLPSEAPLQYPLLNIEMGQ